MLEIHPEAAQRFDERARNVVARVCHNEDRETHTLSGAAGQPQGPTSQRLSFDPGTHISTVITKADIVGEVKVGRSDRLGNQVAHGFLHDGVECWIEGEAYTEVRKLAESIHRIAGVRDILAKGSIERAICEWIELVTKGQDSEDFTSFLQGVARRVVEPVEVRAPIRYLHIEKPFYFGGLLFSPLTREEIDAWSEASVAQNPEHAERIGEYFEKKIRPAQGYACAILRTTSDPERAKELLLEQSEKAIALLRIYTIAAMHPQAVSPCVLWGTAHFDSTFVLKITTGQLVQSWEGLTGPLITPVIFDTGTLAENWRLGCGVLDKLLQAKRLNDFQQLILDAALLYSRCTVAKTVTDKLTYIVAALESVFIANDTESIQSNLADRMAFALERTVDGRRRVIKLVKDTYALRSKFLHHGEEVDDLETIGQFMRCAWHAITGVVCIADECRSKAEMLAELERRKLS